MFLSINEDQHRELAEIAQTHCAPFSLAFEIAGNSNAASTAMIAMTPYLSGESTLLETQFLHPTLSCR
jgi:hypothetical protein